MNSYWITGFIDGEGCFQAFYNWNNHLHVSFKVNQRDDDKQVVLQLKKYFKVGNCYHINNDGRRKFGDKANVKDVMRYQVVSIKDLIKVIIPHFDKYPLQSKKQKDYKIWRQILILANKYYNQAISNKIRIKLEKLCKNLKQVRYYKDRKTCGRKGKK